MKFEFDELDKKNNSSGGYSLIPNGIYEAEIEKIEEKTAKTGNKYKQVTFRLKEEKAKKNEVVNRLLWDNLVLVEQAEWKIQNLLYSCGMPYEGTVKLSDDWNELVGKRLKIGVGTREYQGQERNEVKSYYSQTTQVQSSQDQNQNQEKNKDKDDIPVVEETKKAQPDNKKKKKKKTENNDSDKEINVDDIPF